MQQRDTWAWGQLRRVWGQRYSPAVLMLLVYTTLWFFLSSFAWFWSARTRDHWQIYLQGILLLAVVPVLLFVSSNRWMQLLDRHRDALQKP
jgi:hypothetical protein